MKLSHLTVACLFCVASPIAHAVDYVNDVFPILETHCIGCHTADDPQGGLVMETHAALLAGGDSGLALTAGVASSSRMFLMAAGKMEPVMPPDDMEGPSLEELEVLAKWIDEGAIGPEGDMPIKRELRIPSIETANDVKLPVTALATSRDGSFTATAQFDRVTLTDANGDTIATIEGDLGKINSLSFNQAGDQLLIASGLTGGYGQASLVSVPEAERVRDFVGHRDVLYAAKFSPDGSQIATAGYDQTIWIWDMATGDPIKELKGHNGAIFDLAYSPDGRHLISACADETVKVWDAKTGTRLDTLSQPEGEVYAVAFSGDGRFIVAGGADNRLRVWKFISKDAPAINPIVQTRYVDESPVLRMAFTPDGDALVLLSEAGNVKVMRAGDWSVAAALDPVTETASDLCVAADGKSVSIALMNGDVVRRSLPELTTEIKDKSTDTLQTTFMDLGPLKSVSESDLKFIDGVADVLRGVEVKGTITSPGEVDSYRFAARAGEAWAIDADKTAGDLDPRIVILDEDGHPVLRTRLQAIRDTYFTFRGKSSQQSNDFRLFNWEEIGLNQYLYSGGEVVRTWRHPRGPDSGFDVYPGGGNRHTYFGTTHTTHALGEPAYVVRELGINESPEPNGLPVFDVFYENDDDPTRAAGTSSRLLFTPKRDGRYTVSIGDTRGKASDGDAYALRIRAAEPAFTTSIGRVNVSLRPGTGRAIPLNAKRIDGFDGKIVFEADGLPDGWRSTFPVEIEAGQYNAEALVWVPEGIKPPAEPVDLIVTSHAIIHGRRVERPAGEIKNWKVAEPPTLIPMIQPIDRDVPENEDWTLTIRRGETVSARIVLRRGTIGKKESDGKPSEPKVFDGEVRLGKEDSGHNTAHGVYVDNIGLSGLLVLPGEDEREFFITADPIAAVGERSFFLVAETDGGIASFPITLEVE